MRDDDTRTLEVEYIKDELQILSYIFYTQILSYIFHTNLSYGKLCRDANAQIDAGITAEELHWCVGDMGRGRTE